MFQYSRKHLFRRNRLYFTPLERIGPVFRFYRPCRINLISFSYFHI